MANCASSRSQGDRLLTNIFFHGRDTLKYYLFYEGIMNLTDSKYNQFNLVKEMLEVCDIIANFNFEQTAQVAAEIASVGKLILTGEGSSRIFPAKSAIYKALKKALDVTIITDGSYQAMEYDLSKYVVFGASNSGQTKELITLFSALVEKGHNRRYGLTSHHESKLETVSNKCFVLSCGSENAVAATKSVFEQALFYHSLLFSGSHCDAKCNNMLKNREAAVAAARAVLTMQIDPEIISALAEAPMVYFAGRNDGVAEELTLKNNEITRKKSDFLEGTYALHGVEEVMRKGEAVIFVNPFPTEYQKMKEIFEDAVGAKVIVISTEGTPFATIKIPQVEGYQHFLQLLAGWNILVDVGVATDINLDKPQRARKVGNAL